jgi:small-conductance mechanosensitive channel
VDGGRFGDAVLRLGPIPDMHAAQFFDRVLYNNSMRSWAIALAVALGSFFALLLVRWLLIGRLAAIAKRTTTEIDDVLVEIVARTRPYFLVAAAIVFGPRFLILPPTTDTYVGAAFAIVLLVQCALWGAASVDLWIHRRAESRATHHDAASVTTMRALGIGAKLVLWVIVFITALDKFGVNVTTLVTGLGIGGVAIALAVQNVLGDLFAALSIVLDKPFDVGDSIAVDQMQGTVERIGLKTTRVRSVSGEQIIISNSELLKSRIRNYKRQLDRRVVFTTDVTYDTAPEAVARIPGMIRELISTQQPVRFERSHFTQYTDSALRIETVYYVLDADYGRYLDIQQTINLELLRRLKAEHIELAFPTRTIVLEGNAVPPIVSRQPLATTHSSERIQPPSTAID